MSHYLKLIAILLLLSSCGEKPPLKLTSAQRDQVDTLYNKEVTLLANEMDSLCNTLFEKEMQQTIDSIYKARKLAEKALREKYQNK